MSDTVAPIPAGYHTITPYLAVKGGAAAIDFYQRAFGAEQVRRMDGPDGMVMHAELSIGDSIIQLSDEFPDTGMHAPTGEGWTGSFLLYTPAVDALFERAVGAGATVVSKVADGFSGDRMGIVSCPFGRRWVLATHIEDVPDEEIARRAQEWMESSG